MLAELELALSDARKLEESDQMALIAVINQLVENSEQSQKDKSEYENTAYREFVENTVRDGLNDLEAGRVTPINDVFDRILSNPRGPITK